MKNRYVRLLLGLLLLTSVLSGCEKLKNVEKIATRPAPVVVQNGETAEDSVQDGEELAYASDSIVIETEPERVPVKVKGIYVSAYVAGTPSMVDNLIAELDRTEINTLVIDLKDDFGRIVCEMDCAPVQEIGAVKIYIQDMEMLMEKLREHHIYTIARIPAFRDSWLGEARPDWCVKKADGSLFKDRDGNVWVNPYKREAWDYLVEIGVQAKKLGFQEVQFDYVRFCTEKGMKDAVFDEADVQGRSRTDIILEFMEYTYGKLKDEGLFVSADVFGAIINSGVDADSVGQIYGEMAKYLDYISPMIYPSHYADGNYGIDHPDMHPYDTIRAALAESRMELYFAGLDGGHIATVRPWLQDFTASWLANYIPYGGPEVRAQIQAVYDSGYDEWLLWDAACTYDWSGLMTPEEAAREEQRIEQSRALLPETTYAPETTAPASAAAAAVIVEGEEGITDPVEELGPPPETGSTLPQRNQ